MSNLGDKSKKELTDLAKSLSLKNYTKLSKEELVKVISEAQSVEQANPKKGKTEKKSKPVEERITKEDKNAIAEARVDMEEEPAAEIINSDVDDKKAEVPTERSEKQHELDKKHEHMFSEGYREKVSYQEL